jgi:flagellar biosynthesis protein FlhG
MALDEPKRPGRRRKLGRGLSDISHVFLSGAEKPDRESAQDAPPSLWIPDVDVLSVTSGAGVRGKTFLAANLAFGLSLEGYRLGLVNADVVKPDILDVTGAGPANGDPGVLKSNCGFGGIPEADLVKGVRPDVLEDRASASPLETIEKLAARVQRIIIDTSPVAGTGLTIWRFARLVLVVVEPSSDGMRSSYTTIKRVHSVSPSARIGLVVNFAMDRNEAGKCFRKLSNVCRRFLKTNLRDYGYIVPSEAVERSCRMAVPLARECPESKITRCIDYIVRLIVMDQMAIARRRREVKVRACALRDGR